jgi:hypothetical protein
MNTYLLTFKAGEEHVLVYTPAEMQQLFTAEEIADLAKGRVVLKGEPRAWESYTDMVVAARNVG